ncbi:MAG: hypothetical protein R3B40_02945 [Polyangiales bacterium]|nr:hypothetical protein [Myxococcales bacterium]
MPVRFVRYYLLYFSVLWFVYSVFVWVRLDVLAHFSGIDFFHTPHGTIEGRAMYGGLEVALAIFAFLGYWKPREYLMHNALLWAMINTGFVTARVIGIVVDGGTFAVPFGVLPDSWNAGAMYFLELPSALIFGSYWLRETRAARQAAPPGATASSTSASSPSASDPALSS